MISVGIVEKPNHRLKLLTSSNNQQYIAILTLLNRVAYWPSHNQRANMCESIGTVAELDTLVIRENLLWPKSLCHPGEALVDQLHHKST